MEQWQKDKPTKSQTYKETHRHRDKERDGQEKKE